MCFENNHIVKKETKAGEKQHIGTKNIIEGTSIAHHPIGRKLYTNFFSCKTITINVCVFSAIATIILENRVQTRLFIRYG